MFYYSSLAFHNNTVKSLNRYVRLLARWLLRCLQGSYFQLELADFELADGDLLLEYGPLKLLQAAWR